MRTKENKKIPLRRASGAVLGGRALGQHGAASGPSSAPDELGPVGPAQLKI